VSPLLTVQQLDPSQSPFASPWHSPHSAASSNTASASAAAAAADSAPRRIIDLHSTASSVAVGNAQLPYSELQTDMSLPASPQLGAAGTPITAAALLTPAAASPQRSPLAAATAVVAQSLDRQQQQQQQQQQRSPVRETAATATAAVAADDVPRSGGLRKGLLSKVSEALAPTSNNATDSNSSSTVRTTVPTAGTAGVTEKKLRQEVEELSAELEVSF
jgi:hypothetical protein